MSDASTEVQTAYIAKYRADTTLQGLLSGYNSAIVSPNWNIFDQGGSGQTTEVFPYVYVHPITSGLGEVFSMGTDANDVALQVDVFTAALGFYQARTIGSRLYVLTHGPLAGAIALSGGLTNTKTLFEQRTELEETTDQLVQHIAYRFKVGTQG
jgi:hypothetical protein